MRSLPSLCLMLAAAALLTPAQTRKAAGRPPPAARPGASPLRFVDITVSTGIRFQHASASETRFMVMGGGVLLLDYDSDGWLDIYFTNAPTVEMYLRGERARSALYHNNHDGTFTDVADRAGVGQPGWAMGGAVGDYDNDGWPDIYVTCLGRNVLYHNNRDGSFTDVATEARVADERWSTGAAFADYDGDGDLDLFVSNYLDRHLEDVPKLASAALCPYRNLQVECGPRGLKGAGDTLYRNNGDGTFTDVSKQMGVDDPSGFFGLGVTWSDFDDDGHPDLYVANDATPNYLYHNQPGRPFEERGFLSGTAVSADGTAQAGMGVAVCDFRRDGRFSIYVTNFADEYGTLYRNEGNLAFADATYAARIGVPTLPYLAWGTACADFDNDGWPDLFIVNGHVYPQAESLRSGQKYQQRKQFFLNWRNGTFADETLHVGEGVTIARVGRGAAFGDVDNDGDIDAVVENIDGLPTVLRNDSPPANHWITLQLKGTRSNKLALGARVTIIAGGVSQTDEVRSGGSYLSQNDLRVHFGLGGVAHAESIEIRWPSGQAQSFRNVEADRFYDVTEGESLLRRDHPEAVKAPATP